MNYENIPKQLFDLISDKKYEHLTMDEREMIDRYVTEKEYSEIYDALNDFRTIDSQLDISIPTMKSKGKQSSLLYRIVNYRVPVYMIASSVALLFCAYFLLSLDRTNNEISPESNSLQSSKEGVPIHQDNYPGDLVFEM